MHQVKLYLYTIYQFIDPTYSLIILGMYVIYGIANHIIAYRKIAKCHMPGFKAKPYRSTSKL